MDFAWILNVSINMYGLERHYWFLRVAGHQQLSEKLGPVPCYLKEQNWATTWVTSEEISSPSLLVKLSLPML